MFFNICEHILEVHKNLFILNVFKSILVECRFWYYHAGPKTRPDPYKQGPLHGKKLWSSTRPHREFSNCKDMARLGWSRCDDLFYQAMFGCSSLINCIRITLKIHEKKSWIKHPTKRLINSRLPLVRIIGSF